jgi:hypothetical protein
MLMNSGRVAAHGVNLPFHGCRKRHLYNEWYAEGEQISIVDGMIDWLREFWKLRETLAADPKTANILAA